MYSKGLLGHPADIRTPHASNSDSWQDMLVVRLPEFTHALAPYYVQC
jgi:hypothetical protein